MKKEEILIKGKEFWYSSHKEQGYCILGVWNVRMKEEVIKDGAGTYYLFQGVDPNDSQYIYGIRENNIEGSCFETKDEAFQALIKSITDKNEKDKTLVDAKTERELKFFKRKYGYE